MIELEYYYFATLIELIDLSIKPQKLLSSQKEKQPDTTRLLLKEQVST